MEITDLQLLKEYFDPKFDAIKDRFDDFEKALNKKVDESVCLAREGESDRQMHSISDGAKMTALKVEGMQTVESKRILARNDKIWIGVIVGAITTGISTLLYFAFNVIIKVKGK